MFPYHYGSHATDTSTEALEKLAAFPYHYGSHATTERQASCHLLHQSFHTTMVLTQRGRVWYKNISNIPVSIPLWFSRNKRGTLRLLGEQYSFHTTMVLTQPWKKVLDFFRNKLFPYHYGSHATQLLC